MSPHVGGFAVLEGSGLAGRVFDEGVEIVGVTEDVGAEIPGIKRRVIGAKCTQVGPDTASGCEPVAPTGVEPFRQIGPQAG